MAQVSVSSVAAEVAAPVVPARTRQSVLLRALAPFVIGGAVLLTPTPEGLTVNAWRFFALFVATITGIITEPIPGAAIGLARGRAWPPSWAWSDRPLLLQRRGR